MPTQDMEVTPPSGIRTPLRKPGTQSMAEQSRRTRSPKSALLTVVAAGRPPTDTQAYLPIVFVLQGSTQLRRAMPLVPVMPGDSPGCPIDVDDLLEAAVETEFYYKPELDHYEAASDALRKD